MNEIVTNLHIFSFFVCLVLFILSVLTFFYLITTKSEKFFAGIITLSIFIVIPATIVTPAYIDYNINKNIKESEYYQVVEDAKIISDLDVDTINPRMLKNNVSIPINYVYEGKVYESRAEVELNEDVPSGEYEFTFGVVDFGDAPSSDPLRNLYFKIKNGSKINYKILLPYDFFD